MKLFEQIVRTVINVAVLPVTLVADVLANIYLTHKLPCVRLPKWRLRHFSKG